MFDYFNNHLTTSKYNIKSDKIPASFNNFKIVQISDLHEKLFGENQNILFNLIKRELPNIIVMTGDIMDSIDFENSMLLIKRCTKLCPVYFVEGNHEFHSLKKVDFYIKMLDEKVHIIDNKQEIIRINNDRITISGCSIHTTDKSDRDVSLIIRKINKLNFDKNCFNILLTHRPEFINVFGNYDIDLIFSGHAHGGQWRIFNKGFFAPGQGIFPKFTSGIHQYNNTKEIISRGLGNAVKIPRINNFPEIISCTLNNT